jgi:RNA polymerase primary sigma factor
MSRMELLEDSTEYDTDKGTAKSTAIYDGILSEGDDIFSSDLLSSEKFKEFQDVSEILEEGFFSEDACLLDDEVREGEEIEDYGAPRDLVETYFHSMGNIPIPTREEEVVLAKRLKEGKEIIRDLVTALPLYNKIEESFNGKNLSEEERHEEALHCTLHSLEVLIREIEKAKEISITQLPREEMQRLYERAEVETGIPVRKLWEIWNSIMSARALYAEAKGEFTTRNLRLVINIAKNYVDKGLPFLDLIQEGNIGLMKAVDKFNHERGFKFSTYATWWIRQAITRALIDQTKTVRVPGHMVEFYNKVTRISRELTQSLRKEPSSDEIAVKLGVPAQKIEDVLKAMQEPLTLQSPVGDEDAMVEDFIADLKSPSPYDDTERNEITEKLLSILRTLTPKEEMVIRMRFGIGLEKEHTLDEVGQHLSITRERVRQIETKAMRKLKHPARIQALRVLSIN